MYKTNTKIDRYKLISLKNNRLVLYINFNGEKLKDLADSIYKLNDIPYINYYNGEIYFSIMANYNDRLIEIRKIIDEFMKDNAEVKLLQTI